MQRGNEDLFDKLLREADEEQEGSHSSHYSIPQVITEPINETLENMRRAREDQERRILEQSRELHQPRQSVARIGNIAALHHEARPQTAIVERELSISKDKEKPNTRYQARLKKKGSSSSEEKHNSK